MDSQGQGSTGTWNGAYGKWAEVNGENWAEVNGEKRTEVNGKIEETKTN